ncbi:MAG: hypothetical protein ACLU71_13000 [Blautia hansenii]
MAEIKAWLPITLYGSVNVTVYYLSVLSGIVILFSILALADASTVYAATYNVTNSSLTVLGVFYLSFAFMFSMLIPFTTKPIFAGEKSQVSPCGVLASIILISRSQASARFCRL